MIFPWRGIADLGLRLLPEYLRWRLDGYAPLYFARGMGRLGNDSKPGDE